MNRPVRDHGFTLIEIIVVVLVFSIMSVMAYGGLRSVLDTRRGIETSMQRTAELQRAFLRLRNDFQNLRDRPARDSFGDAQAPLMMDREGEVTLIRGGWRSPLHSARSSLERVRYELKDGALRRASWKVVDLPQQVEPVDLALLKGVDELRWRFLGADREWREAWPSDAQASFEPGASAAAPPPLAVELTLVTKDWGEMRFLFRTPQAGLARGSGADGGGSEGASALITREGLLPITQLQLESGGTVPVPDEDDKPGETLTPTPDDTGNDSGGGGDDSGGVPSEGDA